MFSTWTKRKKLSAVVLGVFVTFVACFIVICIDGAAYDRWRPANNLRMVRQAWLRDGSPEPPQVERYVGPTKSSTTFVYTASQVIDGRAYQGLFAHRESGREDTYVITRGGEVLVIDGLGKARILRIHKTKAAAW